MILLRGEAVRFRHPGQVEDVIGEASFEIASGARIGLVGQNGCGKSTLLGLVQGATCSRRSAIACWRGSGWMRSCSRSISMT